MTPQLFVRLTQDKRAASTFRTVVLPILDPLTGDLPKDLACEGIGFDISYHMHTRSAARTTKERKSSSWCSVALMPRPSPAPPRIPRQDIVNRNKIYVSRTDFGLSLTERDPLNVQALPRSIPAKPDDTSTARSSTLVTRSPLLTLNHPLPAVSPAVAGPADPAPANANPSPSSPTDSHPPLG